jgi:hypothetical protein
MDNRTRNTTTARTTTASPSTERPDQQAARDHVRLLHQAGGTYRAIASAAAVGPMTVHDLSAGRRKPTAGTTTAVLAVTSHDLHRARVDAGGTRLRLRALHVMGHSSTRIARAVGASDQTIRKLVRGDTATVGHQLRDAVTAVYDTWWDKRAPERTPAQRVAAIAARRRAIAGNWCAGAALDDDLLDVPGYRPAHGWKPAQGTGVAADIQPGPRRQSPAEAGHKTGNAGRTDARDPAHLPASAQSSRRRPA